MTADDKTPECEHDMHRYCDGPGDIYREGAPPWEGPLMTLHCGCACHKAGPLSR